MRKMIVAAIFILIFPVLSYATDIKVGDRYLVSASSIYQLHEAVVVEMTKDGVFAKIRHDYGTYNPQTVWAVTNAFQKTVIDKLPQEKQNAP